MTYVVRLRQLPVRHFLSKICSRYSSSKLASVDSTGFGAVLPRPHREEFWIILARERSSSMSPALPLPLVIRVRMSSIRVVPSRHGVHLPHDSLQMKFMKNCAMDTMHVSSSMTTRPPEPMIAPAFFSESKSMGRSMCASVRQPPDGPPICTALNALPFLMPPPMSYTTSRIVVPMGTSIRPVLTTLPVRAKAFVPELPSVPTDLNQSAPFLMMSGTLANVSTLFRQVGLPYRPLSTERGGFVRGMPRLPSMDAVMAEPSPQTNAPAPQLMCIWKLKPLPRMLSPSRPSSLACSMATVSRCTAMGYSART